MKRICFTLISIFFIVSVIAGCGLFGRKPPLIVQPQDAGYQERLAAREIRRYVYQRTGVMLELVTENPDLPDNRDLIVVAKNTHPLVAITAKRGGFSTLLPVLDPGHCLLRTVEEKKRRVLLVTAGDEAGVLYGAYRFARHFGVRFSLTGDVLPAERVVFELPDLNEDHRPQFALRGIQPFHDFPEGPDWWGIEDYKAILSQLPKLGMNFIGFHCYPEGHAGPEPSVWIGQPEDLAPDGTVSASYPAHWFNTLVDTWGYASMPTGEYFFGADRLFDRDDYGPEVMDGLTPEPSSGEESNELFNRTGAFLGEAFAYADRIGIETCIGTESPLTVPAPLRERLTAQGKNPAHRETARLLYEGMFERIKRTYDLDYYWFWTPEDWIWGGNTDDEVADTVADLEAAIEAAEAVDAPFTLATCGWVLGPQSDRALFDTLLPREMPMSCISRFLGVSPLDRSFADIDRRPTWAIPWVEDDPNLAMPQLWAGRMRADAAAAKQYGCEGLIGIHWRTRATGPTMEALAEAAWHQDQFEQQPPVIGPIGENVTEFTRQYNAIGTPIANTGEDSLYQTVRAEVNGYRLELPNGFCRVTLKFCETVHEHPERRVFTVTLQDSPVLPDLDIFAEVGKNAALDYTFERIPVTNGILTIGFERLRDYPTIAGIVVEAGTFVKKINCGGPAYGDYDADWVRAQPRDLMTRDFYRDWAHAQFGPEAVDDIARLFETMDGRMPRPSRWDNGPGNLYPDARPWEEVSRDYAFVSTFERFRPSITGAGNLARFDYWMNSFSYMRAAAQLNCIWGEFEAAMRAVEDASGDADKAALARETALPLYRKMVIMAGEVSDTLLGTVSTPGELGTVCNFQSHSLPRLLGETGERLTDALGEELPAMLSPERTYDGDPRLIVPTLRTNLGDDEPLVLTAIVLDNEDAASVTLSWRHMGMEVFATVPFTHVARGVYHAELAAVDIAGADIEYTITAITAGGDQLMFPADGAVLPQSVVVMGE